MRDELGAVFAAIRPAGTLVGVNALVDPALKVEIEVDAIVGSGEGSAENSAEAISLDQMSS